VRIARTLFVTVLLLGIVFSVISIPKIIKVKEITCRSQYGRCSEEIDKELDELKGRDFFETKKKIKEILSNNQRVANFMIQFKFPAKLVIDIVEKKANFTLKSANAYALVDKEGTVLGLERSSPLPFIEIDSLPPNVGEKVNKKYLFGLNLIYSLHNSYQVKGGKVENESLVVRLPSGIKVIFPLEGDEAVLTGSLKVILDWLNEDIKVTRIEKKVEMIDLRFKNPVLK